MKESEGNLVIQSAPDALGILHFGEHKLEV